LGQGVWAAQRRNDILCDRKYKPFPTWDKVALLVLKYGELIKADAQLF